LNHWIFPRWNFYFHHWNYRWKELRFAYHLFVNKPSTPTGPRAWIRLVLIPTYSIVNGTKWENEVIVTNSNEFCRRSLPLHQGQSVLHHKIVYLHCGKLQHCLYTRQSCICSTVSIRKKQELFIVKLSELSLRKHVAPCMKKVRRKKTSFVCRKIDDWLYEIYRLHRLSDPWIDLGGMGK